MSAVRLPRFARISAAIFSITAGLLLLVLVVLTVADVGSRALWNQSILGTVDISTLLLVAIAFLGLASAEIDGRHVSVGMLEERFTRGRRKVLSAVRAVLLAGIGLLLCWGLGEVLFNAIDRGETTNDILRLLTWPAKLVLFVSFVAFFLAAIAKEIQTLAALRAEPAHRAAEPADAPEKVSVTSVSEGDK